FKAVAAGAYHSCAVRSDSPSDGFAGEVVCWGNNSYGQARSLDLALIILGLHPAHHPSDGFAGEVVCWGNNSCGQAWSHTELLELDSSPITVGGKFLSVSCASTHSCGIFLPQGNTPNV
ncbi:hypothetical protein T484DRAFT_1847571, partial [Baffinella frigidus]